MVFHGQDGTCIKTGLWSYTRLDLCGEGVDRLLEDADGLVDLVRADNEGRDEADSLVSRAAEEDHVTVKAALGDGALDALELRVELDTNHAAKTTDVRDDIGALLLELTESSLELGTTVSGVLDEVLLAHDLLGGNSGGAGDGVGGVGTTHAAGLLLVSDLLARPDGREGETRGNTLGGDKDIRLEVVVLAGEHLTGAAKAGLDLVHDHKDVVGLAELGDVVEVLLGHGHVATLTEDGLHDEAGNVLRVELLLEEKVELLDGTLGGPALVLVGEGGRGDTRHEGAKVLTVVAARSGHGGGGEGATVVRSLHDDDTALAGGVTGDLDGVLNGLSTRVGVEDAVEGLGHDRAEGVGELEHLVMVGDVDLGVDNAGNLLLGGLDNLGVRVTGGDDTDTTGHIEDLAALVGLNPAALALYDDKVREAANTAVDSLLSGLGHLA